jgi:hypothetical protein
MSSRKAEADVSQKKKKKEIEFPFFLEIWTRATD